MNYVDFTVDNKEYKLRLNTKNIVALEKKLGCNPLLIFGKGDTIPTLTQMVYILHASLQQYQHEITLDDAFGMFDSYLDEGNSITDFVYVIMDIYRNCGLIQKPKETDEKN